MAITVDQYSARTDNGSPSVVTFTSNPTAGAKVVLLIAAFFNGGGAPTITSVADNGVTPATWVADASFLNSFGTGKQWIWRADGITLPSSGQFKVTVTWGNITLSEMGAVSLLGAASGGPQSTNTNENTSATSPASVSAGTGAGAGSYYAAIHNDNATTPETESMSGVFTQRFSLGTAGNIAFQIGDFIGSGSQTATFAWTGGSGAAVRELMAVYSAAAASAPGQVSYGYGSN